jgi:hypothetical protein
MIEPLSCAKTCGDNSRTQLRRAGDLPLCHLPVAEGGRSVLHAPVALDERQPRQRWRPAAARAILPSSAGIALPSASERAVSPRAPYRPRRLAELTMLTSSPEPLVRAGRQGI